MKRMLKSCSVIEKDGKYLVLRRSKNISMTGTWEFPTGRLEEKESTVDAATREVKEETGIDIKITKSLGFYEHFDDKTKEMHRIIFVFLATPKATTIKLSDEHDAYEWLTAKEILQKDKVGMDTKHIIQEMLFAFVN